jgi:hypothetical protein
LSMTKDSEDQGPEFDGDATPTRFIRTRMWFCNTDKNSGFSTRKLPEDCGFA